MKHINFQSLTPANTGGGAKSTSSHSKHTSLFSSLAVLLQSFKAFCHSHFTSSSIHRFHSPLLRGSGGVLACTGSLPTASRRRTDGESHSAAIVHCALSTVNRHCALCIVNRQSLKFRRVAMLLCVLMLGIGQMWGATFDNPATKSYASKTFLDVSGTTKNASDNSGNDYLTYGGYYVAKVLQITTWYNSSDNSPSSNTNASAGPSVSDATDKGFFASQTAVGSKTDGNMGYGSLKCHSSRQRFFYVTGITSVAIISNDNGSSKYILLIVEEVANDGTLTKVGSDASASSPGATYSIIEHASTLDPSKYYKVTVSSNSSSNCNFAQIRFGKASSGGTTYTATIQASSNGSVSQGSVSGLSGSVSVTSSGNTLTIGSTTVTAMPNSGYELDNWTVGSTPLVKGGSTSISAATTITANFKSSGGSAPTITTQPTSVINVAVGTQTSLTIVASNATGYQWQSSSSESGTYTDVSDGTSATLNVTPSAEGTVYYKCVVSNSNSYTTSNVVSITATSGGGGDDDDCYSTLAYNNGSSMPTGWTLLSTSNPFPQIKSNTIAMASGSSHSYSSGLPTKGMYFEADKNATITISAYCQNSRYIYLVEKNGNTYSTIQTWDGEEELSASIVSGRTYYLTPKASSSDNAKCNIKTISFVCAAAPTTYTVTFDGNSKGTPASASLTEASAGAGVTLPSVSNVTSGYTFLGWAESSTETDAEKIFAAGSTYKPSKNITLFAIYEQQSTPCTNPTISTLNDGETELNYTKGATSYTLSVGTTGTTDKVEWYVNTTNSTTGGIKWCDAEYISDNGAWFSTIVVPSTDVGTKYYYCIAYNGTCSATSNNVITVHVSGDPTITFQSGTYTIGGAALDLSTLFTSNSPGAVTYAVKNQGETGATINGSNFSATAEGSATVSATQAQSGDFNAKTVTSTITVQSTPTLTALVSGTLYRVADMAVCASMSSSCYTAGLSTSGKFEVLGDASQTSKEGGTPESKTDGSRTLNNNTFTDVMYLKGAATVTNKIPSDRAIKFIIPTQGTLTIYFKKGTKIQLSNGTDVQTLHTSATGDSYGTYDVSAATYYIYATEGSTALYGIQFTRSASSDATLSNLQVNGSPIPDFDPATTSYNVTLTAPVEEVTIAGTPNDDKAKSVVVTPPTGNKKAGRYTITVTAEDGTTTKDYTVDVTINVSVTTAVNNSDYGSASASLSKIAAGTSVSVSEDGYTLTIGEKTITATPTESGAQYTYAFDSWSWLPELVGNTIGESNLTVTANFSRTTNQYAITASVAEGQSEYGHIEGTLTSPVDYGTSISADGNKLKVGEQTITATPADPTAQYTYSFDNWSWTPEGSTITAATTVTATFTRTLNKYKVSFYKNAGDDTKTEQEIEYGVETALTANTFERAGYTFDGWAETANGEVVYQDGASITITANKNLYAHWTASIPNFSMVVTATSHVTQSSVTTRTDVNIVEKGWATVQNGFAYMGHVTTTTSVEVDAVSKVYGYKLGDPNHYLKVVLNAPLGPGSVIAITSPTAYQYYLTPTNDAVPTSSAITTSNLAYTVQEGDALVGKTTFYVWRAESANTILHSINVSATVAPDVWSVYFGDATNGYTDYTLTNGSVTIDNLAKETTYQFKVKTNGATETWYTDQNEGTMTESSCTNWSFSKTDGNNTKLTTGAAGSYTINVNTTGATPVVSVVYPTSYTITFNGHGADDGTMTTINHIAANESVQLPANTFTKSCNDFDKWNAAEDGSGMNYTDEQSVTVTGNMTLYAQWKVSRYQAIYDANGVTGFTGELPAPVAYDCGSKVTIDQSQTLSKFGYTFIGWNTNSAATTPQADAENPFTIEHNTKIYAIWSAKKPTGIAIAPASGTWEVIKGTGVQMNVTLTPDASELAEENRAVTWSTSNTTYASVNQNGYVSFVGVGSVTITATSKIDGSVSGNYTFSVSAGSCVGWEISAWDDGVGNGTMDYFYQVGTTDEWRVKYILPNGTRKFWVGNCDGFWDPQYGGHSKNWDFGWIRLKDRRDNSCDNNTQYAGQDAVGELVIWSNSDAENYGIAFLPNYKVSYMTDASTWRIMDFHSTSTQYAYETDIFQVPAGYYSNANMKYYVGVEKSNGDNMMVEDISQQDAMKSVNGLKDADLAGKFGKWHIWSNSCNNNWYCEFNRYYQVRFEMNDGDGNIDPVYFYAATSQSFSTGTLTNPTRTGYTLTGWKDQDNATYGLNQSITVTKDLVLTAQWTINQYNVNWVTDGDALTGTYTNGSVNFGTTIVAPNTPTKTGYTFKEWTPAVETTVPAHNVEYTATWTINQYNVSWVTDGDDLTGGYTNGSVDFGTAIVAPNTPTKTGYTFAAWSPAVDATVPANDVVYTATWNLNNYGLTFDLDGGSGYSNQSVAYGAQVDVSTDPVKTGYTFTGWTTSDVTITDGKFIMPAKSVTLTATWTAKTYTVTLVDYDGNGGSANITVTYDADCPSDQIKALNVGKAGYDFGGFGIFDGNNYENYIKLDGSTYKFEGTRPGYTESQKWVRDDGATFTAKWTAHTHNVNFDLGGGSGYTDMKNVPYGTEVNVMTDPTQTGYSFNGWTTSDVVITDGKFTMPDNDVTLTANWSVNSYNITPTLTHCTASPAIPATANYGTSISTTISAATGYKLPTEVTVTGATSYSWSAGALSITNVTGAVTITVTAEAIEYNITYNNLNGATAPAKTSFTVEDETFSLADPTDMPTGYTFGGWWTDEDGTGTQVTQIAKGSHANVIVYAKWAKELLTPEINWNTVPTKVYAGGQYELKVTATTDADLTSGVTFTTDDATNATITGLAVNSETKVITAYLEMDEDAEEVPVLTLTLPEGTDYAGGEFTYSGTITLGNCESAKTYTMTILDGSTMSVWPVPTSGSEANSGATWSGIYGGTADAGKELGTCNFTVSSKHYSHYLNVFNGTTSDAKNYIEIVIPQGYEAVFYLVGSTNKKDTERGQWISTTKSNTKDQSIACVSTSSYEPGVVTSEPQEAGTYYYCSDASIRTYELTVTLTGGAGDALQEPELAWKSGVTTKIVDYKSTNFTELATAKSAGTITYSSDDVSVASVNSTTGEVTIGNVGTATISASIAESGCYTASTTPITYTITVNKLPLVAPSVTTNFGDVAYYDCETVQPLTVTATNNDSHDGTTLSYQWYKGDEAISGATTDTYTPTETGSYYCEVTCSWNEYCTPATTSSETKTITLYPAVSFTAHPQTASYRNNEPMDPLTIAVSGGDGENYTYQWQESTDKSNWTSSTKTGNQSASLTLGTAELPGSEAVVNYYRCVVTSNGKCQQISDVATITINNKYEETFTWTGIEDKTFYPTGRYTISVTGLQLTPALSFTEDAVTIQSNETDGTTHTCTFVVNEGVTAITVTASTSEDTEHFAKVEDKVLAMGACEDAPAPVLIWSDDLEDGASFDKDCDAANFTYTASTTSASTGAISYTSSNEDVATISATGEIQINGVRGTTTITATQAASGCFSESKITYIVNVPIVNITKQPTSASYLVGDDAEPLEVIATGKNIQYQWQSSTDNINWTDITTGGDNATYTPSTLEHSTIYYRCQMASGTNCNTVETNVVEIVVCGHYPTITAPTADQELEVAQGETAIMQVVATPSTDGKVLSYQWYKEQDGDDEQVGTNSSVYSFTAAAGTYYCIVSEADGCYDVKSPTFTITLTDGTLECEYKEIVKAEIESISNVSVTGSMASNISTNFAGLSGETAPFKLNSKPSYFGISLSSGFKKGDKVTIHWKQAANANVMQLFTSSDATDYIVEEGNLTNNQEYTMSFELPEDVDGLFMVRTTNNNQNHQIYSISVSRYMCDEGIMAFMDMKGDGKWSTAANWVGTTNPATELPTAGTITQIKKSVLVDNAEAKAAKVVLYDNSKLEIAATAALQVTGIVKRADGSATTVNDIYIHSDEHGTGALVFDNSDGLDKATVEMYSLGRKQDGAKLYQYIGTPFSDVKDVQYNYYGSWIYSWSVADNGWTKMKNGNPANPWLGYCIAQPDIKPYTYWMQGTLETTNKDKMPLTYAGANENLLANSWTAPINITKMETSDFVNAEAAIYIFNAGTLEQYNNAETQSATATSAGQYIVLPVNSIKFIDATLKVIPSMQGFSVLANAADGYVTLDYDRMVRNTNGAIDPQPMRAPQRTMTAEEEIIPDVMHLRLVGNRFSDEVYLLEHNTFSAGFDNGWDGRKMLGDENAPQMSAESEDGAMAISAVPSIDGVVLDLTTGEDNLYTFYMNYNGSEVYYLNDIQLRQSTRITNGAIYPFAASGIVDGRFQISKTPYQQSVVTGSDAIQGDMLPYKFIEDEHLKIRLNGQIYDGRGAMLLNRVK